MSSVQQDIISPFYLYGSSSRHQTQDSKSSAETVRHPQLPFQDCCCQAVVAVAVAVAAAAVVVVVLSSSRRGRRSSNRTSVVAAKMHLGDVLHLRLGLRSKHCGNGFMSSPGSPGVPGRVYGFTTWGSRVSGTPK